MKKLLFTFSLFFSCFIAQAQSIIWHEKIDELDIGKALEILEDKTSEITFNQVNSPELSAQFKKSEQTILSLGFTESTFWLRFTLDNQTKEPAILELSQACLPYADLYYVNETGEQIKVPGGYEAGLENKDIKSHFQAFHLPPGNHQYHIRLLSNSGPIPVKIYSQASFEKKKNKQNITYGMYMGFMIFVILSNVFFFFSMRNYMYLFYSFNVVLYASYAAVVLDGFIIYVFPNINLLFWYITIPTLGNIVQAIYCLVFLEAKRYVPNINRFTWYIIGYFVIWAIVKYLIPLPYILAINTVNALITFFIMGYTGLKVGKKGSKMGYYFASAFFIYFILVLTEAVYIQIGSPPYLAEMSHVAYATLIEAFLFSFLLSKRFEWERIETDKAKAEANRKILETTLENERIVREQNVILEHKVDERTKELRIEKEKSDALLLNILPVEVAEELKQKGMAEAKLFNDVTVMFTDFVNFTGISEQMEPGDLVKEIHKNFTHFDRIIEQFGLEKIKTIGDAYLAVCGLPVSNHDHVQRVIQAAIKIRDFMSQTEQKFKIRIGIHSGPVVAGIVGVKKYAYDIWGDTVNTAARMEQNSEANKINISGATYQLIKTQFNCTYRGKIQAKNKGEIDMYFVE